MSDIMEKGEQSVEGQCNIKVNNMNECLESPKTVHIVVQCSTLSCILCNNNECFILYSKICLSLEGRRTEGVV